MHFTRSRSSACNQPAINVGGFGVLQMEAIANRSASITRQHLAASDLRMRDIEPDELSSSEWVRFLVMDSEERERWIMRSGKRRRKAEPSTTMTTTVATDSCSPHPYDKATEATQDRIAAKHDYPRGVTSSTDLQQTETHNSSALVPSLRNETNSELGERSGSLESDSELPPRYEIAVWLEAAPPKYNQSSG
ncbi:hypothetical protein M433DRAFT_153248 [Acidomyces richmondensis BFW]|nr:MAG: hypothetical protein FE78DRAFT_88866 [Acidomyces sp. 'richmondensis']KYG46561.1 hypothetical protein M433DRAFT_153248 [Acidomyces richmondensis BFW]